MNGYLLTFYTELNEYYQEQPIYEWLLCLTKKLGIKGATVINDFEGIDHKGKFHSASFFELKYQPVQIQFAIDKIQMNKLFDQLKDADISLFYVKIPVEFGSIGKK